MVMVVVMMMSSPETEKIKHDSGVAARQPFGRDRAQEERD